MWFVIFWLWGLLLLSLRYWLIYVKRRSMGHTGRKATGHISMAILVLPIFATPLFPATRGAGFSAEAISLVLLCIAGAFSSFISPFVLFGEIFDFGIPMKASNKGKEAEVVGLVRSFDEIRFYQGPAGKFNSWWYRVFGLENFVSGFRLWNFDTDKAPDGTNRVEAKISESRPRIEAKCVGRLTHDSPIPGGIVALSRVKVDFDKLLRDLVTNGANEETITKAVREFTPSEIDFVVQYVDHTPAKKRLKIGAKKPEMQTE